MDLTSQAIETLQESGRVEQFEFNGHDYTSKVVVRIPLFRPRALPVTTLTALVALHGANFENVQAPTGSGPIFHIESPSQVSIISSLGDKEEQRTTFAIATQPNVKQFRFNEWLSQEEFIIGLQSLVLESDDRTALLRVASKLASEDKLTIEDNGITQNATARSGVSLVEQLEIKPRVELYPWRTFREVAQPSSGFVFRVRKDRLGMANLALFEADGGAWQIKAVANIYDWLRAALPSATVVG